MVQQCCDVLDRCQLRTATMQCCHSTADFQGLWLVNLIQTSLWLVETDTILKLMLSTCHHHILELDLTIIKPQQNLLNEAFFSRKIYDCNFLNPPDQAETWLKTSNIHVGLIAWLNGSMILWPFTCHNSWVFTFNIKIHRKSISFSSVFFISGMLMVMEMLMVLKALSPMVILRVSLKMMTWTVSVSLLIGQETGSVLKSGFYE